MELFVNYKASASILLVPLKNNSKKSLSFLIDFLMFNLKKNYLLKYILRLEYKS